MGSAQGPGSYDRAHELDVSSAAAILVALRAAGEQGSATAALAAAGVAIPDAERLSGILGDYHRIFGRAEIDERLIEALALGFLAGRTAPRKRQRSPQEPTAFMMDKNLLVRAAEGESILRLPWFERELFVGRQLPDISEIPAEIRALAVESYRAALAGERTRYAFTSYGHRYSVDAVPVRGPENRIDLVMAVATPERSSASASAHSQGWAEGGQAAPRRRTSVGSATAAAPALTPREVEVLDLASHGLSYSEIAERLVVTPATIKTHLAHVYSKFNVSDKAAAVAAALRHGIIE